MYRDYDKIVSRIETRWKNVRTVEQAHALQGEIVRGLRTMFNEKKFNSIQHNNHRWTNELAYRGKLKEYKKMAS